MIKKVFNAKTAYTIISSIIVIVGSWVAIRYARGEFRLSSDEILRGTGLLSANSQPTGAQVFIDDKLVTATDDTVYLEPGEYTVSLRKDGYREWRKNITIASELVTQTNARLFPIAPSLSTLTYSGVERVFPSPDGRKLLYYSGSASAQRKNGLYLLDLVSSPLSFQANGPRQIAEDSPNFDLENAEFIWSPDSSEIMLLDGDREVLLSASETNELDTLLSISFQKEQLLSDWETEMRVREAEYLAEFPPEIVEIATLSAKNVYLSPDKKKMLYTATQAVEIPSNVVPNALPTTNNNQVRTLDPGSIYVYDREEDVNYFLLNEENFYLTPQTLSEPKKLLMATPAAQVDATASLSASALEAPSTDSAQAAVAELLDEPSLLQATEASQTARNFRQYHSPLYAQTYQWFPDSNHLLFSDQSAVQIINLDGSNLTALYSGGFKEGFTYPWPDGNRVVIITSFSPEGPDNLYAVEIK